MKQEVIIENGNNPKYNKIVLNRLLLYFIRITPNYTPKQAYELFQKTRIIANEPRSTLKKNMLLQPRCCVRTPPKNGPTESPRYIAAVFMPRALPLSPAGNTEDRIAMAVLIIMAPPIP